MAKDAKDNVKRIELPVHFVDLDEGERAPQFAAYQLDASGRAVRKLGAFDGKMLRLEPGDARSIALGPDVEDLSTLSRESLASYRLSENLELWRRQGVVLPREIWDRFHFHFHCVTGTVRKCRPWFWKVLDDVRLTPMLELAQPARIKPITAELLPHIHFPLRCSPICDGIVEVFERRCCCRHFHIPDLLDRLRDILTKLPIPIPDPIPDPGPFPGPFPGPGPLPGPRPGPDPAPFSRQFLRTTARSIQSRRTELDYVSIPPENLYEDYLALRTMSSDAAQAYVRDRYYLYPIFCTCSVRKVGQTPIHPGGTFSLCYPSAHTHTLLHRHCVTTYAYRVRQLVNGVLTTVYDGLAAHEYFAAGESADIRTGNPSARVCADGPGDPPPNDGSAFVMLEHIGSYGTFHFNFPAQTGVSQLGALGLDDGTYTTLYAPDCPWGGALGIRLWFSPELEPIVKYYRLSVVAANDAGQPVGAPMVLDDTVTWDKLIDIPGDIVRVGETLGPNAVGPETNLYTVPYWSSPDHRYLSGQYHQVWNTAQTKFPDGRYLLLIEVFDGGGNRIKPNGAAGPGAAQAFQFRRWVSSSDTDPVPYADAAHLFWIDNTPVGGDIVDLRRNGIVNTAECQFMTGPGSTTFAIGFRAYHLHGVEHAGNGDDNSFMWHYAIGWQRGLNGSSGSLGPAPSGGTNHTDVGETGGAVSSGSATFETMLTKTNPDGTTTVLPKCTFSVSLHVYAKHFTGGGRINGYDYHETASFALEIARTRG